jgi:hypothetical protein
MTFRAAARTPKSRSIAPERRAGSLPDTWVRFFRFGDGCAFACEGDDQPHSPVRVLPARAYKNEVEPRGFESLTSALQGGEIDCQRCLELAKFLQKRRICTSAHFSRFQDMYSGCCTVAAQILFAER